MRKLLLSSIFVLSSLSSLFAINNLEGYMMFRTSETSSADDYVQVATGIIVIDRIEVASGSLASSTFQFFNSTVTSRAGIFGVSPSSSIIYDIDTAGDKFNIRQTLSNGFNYTKTGTSSLVIFWDWVKTIPRGQENRGRK